MLKNLFFISCLLLSQLVSAQESEDIVQHINKISNAYNRVPVGVLNFATAYNTRESKESIIEKRNALFVNIEESIQEIKAVKLSFNDLGLRDSSLKTISLLKTIINNSYSDENIFPDSLFTPEILLIHYDRVDSLNVEIKKITSIAHQANRDYINHFKLIGNRDFTYTRIENFVATYDYFINIEKLRLQVAAQFNRYNDAWNNSEAIKMVESSKKLDSLNRKSLTALLELRAFKNDSSILKHTIMQLSLIDTLCKNYIPGNNELYQMPKRLTTEQVKRNNQLVLVNKNCIDFCQEKLFPTYQTSGELTTAYFRKHLY